ncbi:FadR/GntR family transcriptional regulator [uncultured Cohaesibacter sp.]|uniref:FadR/GntR family transcriptional regulator n=1 Tax=uncultured Cohaesibacter sp. TaxID=1002546 RepID=UPI0029C8D7BA|nr:FadR/GntR family transcriptional regulator [uncultured Cohaesibacter sp.]
MAKESASSEAPDMKQGRKLSHQLYEQIIRLILDTNLAVGDKLPTEARFCELFSVSRTVVREALERLKIDGIIASHQGRGSLLLKRPNRDVFTLTPVSSIAELQMFFEFRQVIEGETAAFAAQRHNNSDLQKLEAALDAIDAAFARQQRAVEEDLAFHFAVAEAARNKFLQATIEASRSEFLKGMRFARELTIKYSEERGMILQTEHRAILTAIRNRDSEGARSAMITHIARTRDRVFTGTT